MKKILSILLLLAVLPYLLAVGYAEPEQPYYRIDRNDPDSELANLRLLTAGRYTLKPLSSRYGVDPDYTPSLEGMDSLHISGSVEFSEQQFRALAATLRECADGDPIYIVDLRQESHALVNGTSVSLYASGNAANKGMSTAQVEADERQRFGSMPGTTLVAYSGRDNTPRTIEVVSCMTERELVQNEGIGYLRLAATDHLWPDANLVDDFIDFVKGVDMNHVWLHFHCLAGLGRTGIFMCIYDMMKNPGVPLEDIVARQAMTGAEYLLQSSGNALSIEEDKSKMIRLAYQYIQENRATNYQVRWSDWVEAHTRIEMPNLDDYNVLYLPNDLTVIEEEAFAGTACEIVVIPKSCTQIHANTFNGASQLKYIIIPADAKIHVSRGAFNGTDATIIRGEGN